MGNQDVIQSSQKAREKKSVVRTAKAWRFDDAFRESFGASGSECASADECMIGSGDNALDHRSGDVGQPEIAAAESICQFCVIESE